MPFTVSPSSYRGGDYLFAGISQAAQGITGAVNQWTQVAQQADQSDALMKYLSQQTDPTTGKPIVDAKALEAYQQHSMRQRAAVAGAMSIGMPLVQSLQHYANATRESIAHTNYYTAEAQRARAEAEAGGAGPGRGKIWSDELGGWATPAQAARAAKLTPEGQIQSNYGLTTSDIFNSKIHEAGTAVKDPATGALKFTNDPKGDQIRIGGEKGVIMPRAEHEIYKRQLQQRGYDPATGLRAGAAGPGGGGGGAQDPAIAILQQNGKPLTPANIAYVRKQLAGAGGDGGAPGDVAVTATRQRMSAPAGAPAGGGSKWIQGTDAQGQPYWYTNEGDYSATPPNG